VKTVTPSVGTAPTSLTAGIRPASRPNYRHVVISNPGNTSAYIGGPDVSASDYGYELQPGRKIPLPLSHDDEVFAVVAAGSLTLDVHDEGLVNAAGTQLADW
jgi:hypothetical protein